MSFYTITRQIGIDAAHRVPDHGSKCANIHGHRYTIEATCIAYQLHREGEQKDMGLDFGFLKQIMMNCIDIPCDHGMILSIRDPLVREWFPDVVGIADSIRAYGHCQLMGQYRKCYIIRNSPTAEALAKHWFLRMEPGVFGESKQMAKLMKVKVWETPNCFAEFVIEDDEIVGDEVVE